MKYLIILFSVLIFSGCNQKTLTPIDTVKHTKPTPSAWKVLKTGNKMIKNGTVVKGSCWDYIDCIYTKAGCTRSKRKTIFRSKKRGPYVNAKRIKAGDWLYFINGAFHNSEHSGIFVKWINYKTRTARMLSYQGLGKRKPARYKNYVLNKVYNIMRVGK